MQNFKNLPTEYQIGETPWNVYPRPTLKRNSFYCLNGKWNFGVAQPENPIFNREIIVPFPPESTLSNVGEVFDESETLYYKKVFSLPDNFVKDKVLLHFGAVDQKAKVFLNGNFLGEHIGGYTPFSFDITTYLLQENILVVEVIDTLSDNVLPYGKQKKKRGGMWYTPVSGIWQTVWLESVPENYIKGVTYSIDGDTVKIFIDGVSSAQVIVTCPEGELSFQAIDGVAKIKIEKPILWSPENPYLYHYTIKAEKDEISSYFAIRTLSIENINGIPRTLLNGKPYFFHGLLDQGYFSDGIFTPANQNAYTDEIKKVKALGFNTLRKHIKVEPQFFYAECDRLGIIVWQDMVNNGKYSFFKDTAIPTVIRYYKRNDKKRHKDVATRNAFISNMSKTVEFLKNHPSICLWTIFNEGWGQFESEKAYDILKNLDKTRFIDTTSGWFKCGKSDFESKHIYFRKIKIKPCEKPVILSEFGGYAYRVENHIFNEEKSFGYANCKTREEFVTRLVSLYESQVIPAIKQGLCASIYTQVSDVEDEINGIFTYDRKVEKILPEEFINVSNKLYREIEK